MKQQSRRPGTGDGSNVLLGRERSEPTKTPPKPQQLAAFT